MEGRRIILAAILLCVTSVTGVSAAIAQTAEEKIIDRVVAVVEDKAVLQSELEMEFGRYLMQAKVTNLTGEEESRIRKEVLEGMIADLLMTVHAEKKGIEVSDEQIDAATEQKIEESKRALGDDEAFETQLEIEGLTIQQLRTIFREKIRSQMLNERLMRRDVWNEIEVSEGEARAYYREHIAELPKRPATITLAHILMVPEASDKSFQAAMKKIEEIKAMLEAGAEFAELAGQYSDCPSAKYGGSLGYLKLDDLNNPEFEKAVRKLTVGETSDIVQTGFGCHIIRLDDVMDDKVRVRHILVKVEGSEADVEQTSKLAGQIRQQLIDGADFGEMAVRHSSDSATKNKGGVVGEIPQESLPGFFREIIRDVGEGEIAPLVKEEKGFRIVKVLGRTDGRPYTFTEARDELKKLIQQQKLQEKFHEYVDGLKDIYYVEMRGKP